METKVKSKRQSVLASSVVVIVLAPGLWDSQTPRLLNEVLNYEKNS